MKKKLCAFVILAAVLSLSGCKGSVDEVDKETETAETEETVFTETEEITTEEKQPDNSYNTDDKQEAEAPAKEPYIYTNEYGFTMRYDDDVFEKIVSGEEGVYFIYRGRSFDDGGVPVYVSASVMSDFGVDEVKKNLDDHNAEHESAVLGSSGYDCDVWSYIEETENGTEMHRFYMVSVSSGLTAVMDMCMGEADADNNSITSALSSLVESFSKE